MGSLTSTLKNSPVIARHEPKFGYTISGTRSYSAWYRNLYDKIVACSDKSGIDTLADEFFSGSRLLGDIPDISKKISGLPWDSCEYALRDFENRINGTPSGALNSLQWKALSTMACMFGLHSAGYAFRKKAIEYLYSKGVDNPDMSETCTLFAVAMELGDFETSKYILDKRLKSRSRLLRKMFSETKQAGIYYSLLRGDPDRLKMAKKRYTNEDKAFARYVNGKRIAVVGPAPSSEESGSEIDAYDIIVRVAYKGREHIDAKTAGSRTDVSYYISRNFYALLEMENKEFLYDLNFVVQKYKKNKLNMSGVCERTLHFVGLPFCGSYNMIPLIATDLLMFDIAELKIFHTNFYLDHERYAKGQHIPLGVGGNYDLLTEISLHDQITQISLIRNLWENNMCKADNALERILGMPNEDIMNDYNRYFPYIWA